jgi:hypothetical protein
MFMALWPRRDITCHRRKTALSLPSAIERRRQVRAAPTAEVYFGVAKNMPFNIKRFLIYFRALSIRIVI